MGQKCNPISNRLGIIRGWESNWYAGKDADLKLVEDVQIRKFIEASNAKAGISKTVIERTLKRITVTIHTSRPGIIIGKGGADVDKLKEALKKLTSKDVQINIMEIRKPEADAVIVGDGIARQLEARVNFKRAVKMAITSAMRVGVEGIKVRVSGRLGGAEMARSEEFKQGRTPLHTFRADIDYSWREALTIYGKIGIKTWICKGEILGKVDLSPNQETKDSGAPKKGFEGDRRGGGDRRDGNRGGGDRRGGGERREGGGNRDAGNRGPRK
jgi:small subunit ribosomal protein S3